MPQRWPDGYGWACADYCCSGVHSWLGALVQGVVEWLRTPPSTPGAVA